MIKSTTKKTIKIRIILTAGVLRAAAIAAVLIHHRLYVTAIRDIRIFNIPEEGYRLTRYGEEVKGAIAARVEADNELASRELRYESSDPEIVTVSEEGVLTAGKQGNAVVKVISVGNPSVSRELPVTVIQKAMSMQVALPEELPSNEYYYLIHRGDRVSFRALPEPADARVENLTYTSSRPSVASVSEDGEIRAYKGGTSLISVYWVSPYTPEGQKVLVGEFWVNVCRKTDHDSLTYHELQWYEESCLIAHALGNAGDYKYTNTRDALEESISEGFKVIEVDLAMTSDKEVVCRHNWKKDTFDVSYDGRIPDLATFEKEKYFGTLTTLTARGLLEIWAEHPELYFITDVKQDENTDLPEVIEHFVALAREMGQEKLLERLIVQLYNAEDYDKINAIYPMKHWLFTFYQLPKTDEAEEAAAKYSKEMNFGAFTVPVKWKRTGYFTGLAEDYKMNLFVHVVDEPAELRKYMKRGIYGFYTDYWSPKKLQEMRENGEN